MHGLIQPPMLPAGTRQRPAGTAFARGICLGLAVMLGLHPAAAMAQSWAQLPPVATPAERVDSSVPPPPRADPQPAVARRPKTADFQHRSASAEVRHVAHWVVDSGDSAGMPYLIVDKVNAEVFVFDASGQLKGAEPALLGMAPGDHSTKGVGEQTVSALRSEDRTTPAGRFVASVAQGLHGQDILWIDYASALALHRVVKGTPAERRAERLLSATPRDNRISFGCINVPVKFFEDVVSPAFTNTSGVVYILPEMGAARELFGSYEVDVDGQAGVPVQP